MCEGPENLSGKLKMVVEEMNLVKTATWWKDMLRQRFKLLGFGKQSKVKEHT